MSGLQLYYSNRLERLADSLALLLKSPLDSPLTQEIILIPAMGMARWLSLELAQRLGICANIRFIFPRVFTRELFSGLNAFEEAKYAHFSPATETWRLLDLLSRSLPEGGDALAAYLGNRSRSGQAGDGSPALEPNDSLLKPLQLAERLAETFDKYLLFRPEIIRAWEASPESGPKEDWQAGLWRGLFPPEERKSPLASRDAFFRHLKERGPDYFALPKRMALVNINFLPGFYLEIARELSHYIDVNLFYFNPSGEYWADIRSEREIGNQIRIISEKSPGRQFEPGDLYLETGNSLLASLGRGARHFFALLMEIDPQLHDLSEAPPAAQLLGYIQQDIFTLTDRGKAGAGKTIIGDNDWSLQIHSCHSPLREVEVLYDSLLFLLEQMENLKPKDILVLAPDIETYAPFIEAVFSFPDSHLPGDAGRCRIPFSLAHRGDYAEGVIGNCFMKLLDLLGGRHEASGLIELLDSEAVRNRFDLSEEEARTIRRWVIETKIQWGRDAQSKEELGLPPIYENTWQAGLDRLFSGYAFSGAEKRLFQDILPFNGVEGDATATLGKMAEFLEFFFDRSAEIKNDKTLAQWSRFLLELLGIFRPAGESQQEELNRLLREVRGLAQIEKEAAFFQPIDFAALKYYLIKKLLSPSAVGFMTGGVTFSSFIPMSGIPARVIWLLGMNYAAFPGQSPRYGFDLTLQRPQTGDPSRRDEERYLFLQALLSARDCLAISYIGQSNQDNAIIPPSATVSELLDYIDRAFIKRGRGDKSEPDWMVTRHPLQPFHRSYFFPEGDACHGEKPGLFSYSRENYLAACALEFPPQQKPEFIPAILPDPPDEFKNVAIDDLVSFFRHPARYFLQQRLGIYLRSDEIINVREKFDLTGLDRYQLDQQIVGLLLEPGERTSEETWQLIRATGTLTQGAIGEVHFNERYQEARDFVSRLSSYGKAGDGQKLPVEIRRDGYWITGILENIFEDYRLIASFRNTDGRELLGAWVQHVIMNANAEATAKTLLINRDKIREYRPLPHPDAILSALLMWYGAGLKFPLKLFGDLSWEFAQAVITGKKTERDALEAARLKWVGNDLYPGVGEDPYLRQCFSGRNPIDEEFATISRAVFGPMIGYL